MQFHKIVLVFILTTITLQSKVMGQSKFDIQGHRGCRGLLPENSIPAFQKALDLGVTTLELDVVISKDSQVIVSHEPFMSGTICLDPQKQSITKSEEEEHNIYQLTYDQVQQYDCGSRGNARFPEQTKMAVSKPLLREVIRQMEAYRLQQKLPPFSYNIEIKSTPAGDHIFHPAPEAFSDLVYNVLNGTLPLERVIIQSFDFRVLKYWHQQYPLVTLAALLEEPISIDKVLNTLGFTPAIYSPYFKLLPTKQSVKNIQRLNMKVIPWTVNEIADIKKLKSWGVDGLITDYPDRAISSLKE